MTTYYRKWNKGLLCFSLCLLVYLLMVSAADLAAGDGPSGKTDSLRENHIKVYYFHTNYRCTTCKNMEKYTIEAINANFTRELEQGKLIFSSVNVDEDSNKHFVKDYKLYTKHVILSKMENEKEIKWKNLDQVWVLVRSPEKFKDYIVRETRMLLAGSKK